MRKFTDVSHMFLVLLKLCYLELRHSKTVVIIQPFGYIFISTFPLLDMCPKHEFLFTLLIRRDIIFNNILRLNLLLLVHRTNISSDIKIFKFQSDRCRQLLKTNLSLLLHSPVIKWLKCLL